MFNVQFHIFLAPRYLRFFLALLLNLRLFLFTIGQLLILGLASLF